MTFPRPIKRLKAAFRDLCHILRRLTKAINRLADCNADLLESNEAIQKACQTLVAIELHRQRAAGQKENF